MQHQYVALDFRLPQPSRGRLTLKTESPTVGMAQGGKN